MKNPNIEGPAAKAWNLIIPFDHPCTLAMWWIESPHFHAAWSRWCISFIHLRDTPKAPKAILTHPDNTHEMIISAIHPDSVEPLSENSQVRFLDPPDVALQIRLPDDGACRKLAERCAREVCQGSMSPDQDFRRVWNQLIPQWAKELK